jgi:hypothetical protein
LAILSYLTIFRSRLGGINLTLPLTSYAYQPQISLLRKLKEILDKRVLLDTNDPQNEYVFQYLLDKKLIGKSIRQSGRSRYKSYKLVNLQGRWQAEQGRDAKLNQIPIFLTDIWLADPDVPSTIGAPTIDNSEEMLELCYQIGTLSKTKNTWTAAGQLISQLRSQYSDLLKEPDNPFLLGLEAVVFLRQIIEADGLLLRELLLELSEMQSPFKRDVVALQLPALMKRVLDRATTLRLPTHAMTEIKQLVKLMDKTASKRSKASSGPGVLEHRTTPRLEWLCDLGVLSKSGLPKNGFEYIWTSSATGLLNALAQYLESPYWAEEVAIKQWRTAENWALLRNMLPSATLQEALLSGYRLMQRIIGPSSIRDVCFAAAILMPLSTVSFGDMVAKLIEWASVEKEITLSGGHYVRRPELVHISSSLLNAI